MQTLRILFILLVVLVGIVVLKEYVFKQASVSPKKESALNQPTHGVTPTQKNQQNENAALRKAKAPTITPTMTPVPPTSVPTEVPASSLAAYRYPNASVTSQSQNEIDMTSGDAAQTITDWYKNTIAQQGLHTTSFVQTSTNGDILNKLAAGLNGGGQVTVTITKSASSGSVSISVTISRS